MFLKVSKKNSLSLLWRTGHFTIKLDLSAKSGDLEGLGSLRGLSWNSDWICVLEDNVIWWTQAWCMKGLFPFSSDVAQTAECDALDSAQVQSIKKNCIPACCHRELPCPKQGKKHPLFRQVFCLFIATARHWVVHTLSTADCTFKSHLATLILHLFQNLCPVFRSCGDVCSAVYQCFLLTGLSWYNIGVGTTENTHR